MESAEIIGGRYRLEEPIGRGGMATIFKAVHEQMMDRLVAVKVLVVHRQAFGEALMFVYFGYLVPLTRRIGRGFYEDGIWADSAFIPYNEVGGISWRESEHAVSLIVISRLRNLARRLAVPLEHYGAARRLLRDKIGEHEIHFFGTGLDLGGHDERDEA